MTQDPDKLREAIAEARRVSATGRPFDLGKEHIRLICNAAESTLPVERPRQYPDPGTLFPDQEWG